MLRRRWLFSALAVSITSNPTSLSSDLILLRQQLHIRKSMENGLVPAEVTSTSFLPVLLAVAGFAARVTWVGGLLISCVVALLWYFQEKLLFYPGVPQGFETPDKNPKGLRNPGERGMPYEELWLKTSDGVKLHSWLIKQKQPQVAADAPTIIFFQGNAGNIGFRLPNAELLYKHVGANILMVSYRGYGFSEGSPTEAGVYKDGEAAIDMLMKKHKKLNINPNKILLFGRSLGGAVAIELANSRGPQVRGVIVENTFTSLRDMLLIVFPFLRPIKRLVTIVQRLYMDNGEKVRSLQRPILFISGQKDELVPPAQMKKLYEEKEDVPLGGHNDTWEWAIGGKRYYDRVTSFIRHALAVPQQQSPHGERLVDDDSKVEESYDEQQAEQCSADNHTLWASPTSGSAEQKDEHPSLPLSVTPAGAAASLLTDASDLASCDITRSASGSAKSVGDEEKTAATDNSFQDSAYMDCLSTGTSSREVITAATATNAAAPSANYVSFTDSEGGPGCAGSHLSESAEKSGLRQRMAAPNATVFTTTE